MHPKIMIRNLSKAYDGFQALEDVNFEVRENEFVCVLGPSGCGKTTLLRILSGFEPYTGEVKVDGTKVESPAPDRFVVFQEFDQLLPWKTVYKNIEFGLRIKDMPKDKSKKAVMEVIELVGLSKFENSYPHQLSGGMKQRVAIARALVMNPSVLLMDEPFGSLDAQMRKKLQGELVRIWQKVPKTIVFVTHNIHEAIILGDKVFVMTQSPGRIKDIIDIDLPRPRTPSDRKFRRYWNKLVRFLPSVT